MIIKSMSRKSKSFSQLYHYMKNGSSQSSVYDFFAQNIYARQDRDIVSEFSKNARKVKARKNGNYLFHEIISITKSKQLSLDEEKERLFDIVQQYAQKRCPHNLVTGYLHDEKENNVHYHLMISSNELDCYNNQRLTKYEFDKVKKDLEKYVIEKYPELEQDVIINASNEQKKQRQSNKAGEVERKGGRLEKKEKITQTLRDIFAQSRSMNDLFTRLSEHNIEMYNRGKTIGFINKSDNKKYRLKTLGLETDFQQIDNLSNQSINKQSEESKSTKQKYTKAEEPKSNEQYTQENKPLSEREKEIERRKAEMKKARRSNRAKDNDKDLER